MSPQMVKQKEWEVCSLLKSVLTSCGGKLPMNRLNVEYKTVVGADIPFRELMYPTLAKFLQSIPEILKLETRDGQVFVSVVADKNIDLILRHVMEQKPETVKAKPWRTEALSSAPRHLHSVRPVVPLNQWHCYIGSHATSITNGRTPRYQSQKRLPDSKHTSNPKVQTKKPSKKTFKQQLVEAVQTLCRPGLVPTYNTVSYGKKKLDWCSTIKIGDLLTVSSYPDSMKSQEEAEEAASKKALQQLPQVAKKRQAAQNHAAVDYDVSIPRVKQLLEKKSPVKRFWWEAVQGMYWDMYQEKLPHDWITVVQSQNNTGLEFNNPCTDLWTVALAQKIPSSGPKTSEPIDTSTSCEQEEVQILCNSENKKGKTVEGKLQLPTLKLPSTPTWDVVITCVEEHDNIHLRLVGENYSEKFDELVSEMESHYTDEKHLQSVKEPAVGDICAARHEDSWFRVKVLETLNENVHVKFVDEGDSAIIPLCDLYDLHERFVSLPPQDLQCCLAGLEDAPREAARQTILECLPMNQALVARVQRRQEPYALVFFDTSTSEDINLNDKLFESLVHHISEPSLPPVGCAAEVYLTYASCNGIIYFQEDSDTLTSLIDLLKIARRRIKEMPQEVSVDLTKLYLVYFCGDGEWYRARPKSPVDANGKVLMEFVDFGDIEKVSLSNIRNFEAVSPLLAKLPHQALPCILHNVPSNPDLKWTVKACQRLVDLTSRDTHLLLKVVSQGTGRQLPTVQLFKRLLPQNELVSINDTLGIDDSLFRDKEDKPHNTEKDAVLCHGRPLSSCVSDASLQVHPPSAGLVSFPPCASMSPSDIPDVGSYFDVIVTFAASPYLFAVQPWSMSKKYGELSDVMQKYYNNPVNVQQVVEIKGGQYCALKHKDNLWYRY
ncbi:tudor domain-containing protein 7B-like isoform X2 [Portunus trituberculatus]|uniref:tudor domain-containing protein 7B-like isoform X2 n=1 Tax=Portunus trituberculatus TaxID=210409 RepID=UPI001E1D087C|nr:tudor domain-containing protein 7B-like isoform X2 [Portunus trituberculatus]